MLGVVKNIYFVTIFLLLTAGSSTITNAQTTLDPWIETMPMADSIASNQAIVYGNNIVVLGGSNYFVPNVGAYSTILSNGSLGNWNGISATLTPLFGHMSFTHNGSVYILGGRNSNSFTQSTIYKSIVQQNGDITSWQSLPNLPKPLANSGVALVKDKLYIAGGDTSSNDSPSTSISEIYSTSISSIDGSLGSWTIVGYLPEKMLGFGMMEIEGYLYIFGGYRLSGVSDKIQRAPINVDNDQIGEWEDVNTFPTKKWRFGITRSGNTIVIVGGHNYSEGWLKSVYLSTINQDGSISSWQVATDLPYTNCCAPLVSKNNYIYFLGGMGNIGDGFHDNGVYTKKVIMTRLNDPPPPQPAVSKVFFIPGLGGSWNPNAFATCSFDPNPTHWSLAPYAEEIYNPLLNALTNSGWNVKPFYYDWRLPVVANSTSLNSFVNQDLAINEKVNIIGHSLGGLIGRQYLEDTSGVKLSKLLTAGSPHMGVVLAYPAWSGGSIWQNDLITKIATTLYTKHCGHMYETDKDVIQNTLPIINNLLPIFTYLKLVKTGDYVLFSEMIAKNLWHSNNNFDTHGVQVETLSGSGFSTLSEIQIKEPSKRDLDTGNWFDGKPIGKIFSTEGDGTVLAISSKLPGVTDKLLNLTHSKLVNSSESISEILNFLGTPSLDTNVNTLNPESALIIFTHPSETVLTDQEGNNLMDKNGLISIINPKSANYKIKLLPKSNSTLLIVAQFLANGQTFYKEYKLDGLGLKQKTIRFDLQNPQEDILN